MTRWIRLVSLYGYPREPDATGDETPAPHEAPGRISSEPVAVPGVTPSALPPEPLLPAFPPGFVEDPYPSVAGRIPGQRPGPVTEPVPTAVESPATASAEGLSGRHSGSAGSEHAGPGGEDGFPWLRSAEPEQPVSGGPSPAAEAPGSGPSPSMGQPTVPAERPPVGPSPGMGQPSLPLGQPPAAKLPSRPEPGPQVADRTVTDPPSAVTATPASAKPGLEQFDVLPEERQIPPWDRRPLMIVLATAVALVLVGIVSGMVSASLSRPAGGGAFWHDAESDPQPGPTEPAPPPPPGPISLSAVGDTIIGTYGYGLAPNGGAGFFDPVKEALATDLVMGNLEQALSEPTGYTKCGGASTSCFAFGGPPSYAQVLRDAGFGLMTINNNHTNDLGGQGIANTRASLDAAGVAHTGGVDQITYVTVKDVRVAAIGFASYPWGADLNNIPKARELVRQADLEADIVVVQFHGGAEGSDKTRVTPAGQPEYFLGENRGDLRSFSHAVIDAGADLVVGHGPHVLRGIEFYQGRLVAYSLGNFAGYRSLSSNGWNGVGAILKVTLNHDGTWVSGQLVATEMVGAGTPAIDTDLRALAFVDNLSVQDFGPAAVRVDRTTGEFTVPG